MQAIICEMCGSHLLTKRNGVLICQNCGTRYTSEDPGKNRIIEKFEEEYSSTRALSKRIDLIYTLKIPNQKDKLLDVFYLAASHVARSDIHEAKLDEAWQIKLEKAYLKAGDVIDDKKQLSQIHKLYKSKQKEIKKWRKKIFWDEHISLVYTIVFLLLFVIGSLILINHFR